MFIDFDGRFGFFTHFFSGGWDDMEVDWDSKEDHPKYAKYKKIGRKLFGAPSGPEKDWASQAHSEGATKDRLDVFLKSDAPRRYKEHAIDDYYNEGAGSRPMTGDEQIVQELFGKENREWYQDGLAEVQILLDPGSAASKDLALRGEHWKMLDGWGRNPFMLLNDQHQQTMHELTVELPLSNFDPTGTTQLVMMTRSIVKRIVNLVKWIRD
jgi:hypothetical protein